MLTCTKRIEFDAAHRVREHRSVCKMLHGHRYAIEATFASQELNQIGMIIDFGEIKDKLKSWIDKYWDHNTILHADDENLGRAIGQITTQNVFFMNCNPTAENMANFVLHEICPSLFVDTNVQCIKIRLYETPSCYAEATIEKINAHV
ncbi:6-carboxytetrahydropterin synthase [Rickettsiales endosymbiont of Peranema trichophorum]|nr:6-carboxytetrahydropterin synthase [Rickettsiales endosymbiont of Peranema trichophorum]RZI47474.1 6-carboxytetrahydropterin synthase [Rickettsiales endosymbiont of Peranema trichophorum]